MQTFLDGQIIRPVLPQNIQRDASQRTDVGMINPCCEMDARGRVRIISTKEINRQEEQAALIWAVELGQE